MDGQVTAVAVAVDDHVEPGDLLIILEAMKIEHRLRAPWPGESPRCGRPLATDAASGPSSSGSTRRNRSRD